MRYELAISLQNIEIQLAVRTVVMNGAVSRPVKRIQQLLPEPRSTMNGAIRVTKTQRFQRQFLKCRGRPEIPAAVVTYDAIPGSSAQSLLSLDS